MSTITNAQLDAYLDVRDQCRVVTHEWEAQATWEEQCRHQGKKVSEIADYTMAISDLASCIAAANEAGVDQNRITGVLLENLPKAVVDRLMP